MLAKRRSGHRYLLVLAALAMAASCSDRTQITNPLTPQGGNRAAAAPPNGGKVKIKQLQLSSNTLNIDGPTVTGNVSIGNSGAPIDNVALSGHIVQGATTRVAATAQLTCAGNPGTLPNGTCDMSFTAAASNSADGTGTLVPGAAVFVLDVVQDPSGAATVLASKSLNVNLVGAVTITSLTMQSTTLVIDGASVGWTATLNNPGGSLNNVVLQGEMVQGTTVRAAGGLSVDCGSAFGVLPPGTCTVSFTAVASNSTAGDGTLVPGAAVFRLQLIDGGTSTVLDTRTVDVTLAAPHIAFTDVTLSSTYLVIDGPAVSFSATVENTTSSTVSPVVVQVNLIQNDLALTTTSAYVQCGAGDGVLTPGTCSASGQTSVSGGVIGLTTGDATLEVRLLGIGGSSFTIYDTRTYPVLVVASSPGIVKIEFSSTTLPIGQSVPYTVTLYNPTDRTLTLAGIQGEVIQGNTNHGAGGADLACGGASGSFPPGLCTFQFTAIASNSTAGTGTFVDGNATFKLTFSAYDPLFEQIIEYDVKTVAVTLVTP